jgi:hypothetical protein
MFRYTSKRRLVWAFGERLLPSHALSHDHCPEPWCALLRLQCNRPVINHDDCPYRRAEPLCKRQVSLIPGLFTSRQQPPV